MRGGEEVKISKRAGSYVTLRDLIDWTSRDAVRFFLLSRKADTEFTFDVDLALEQNDENPVYYVQYAHARICSVLAQYAGAGRRRARRWPAPTCALLTAPSEAALMRKLAEYPDDARRRRGRAWRRTRSPSTCASSRRRSTATTPPSASWSTTRRWRGRAWRCSRRRAQVLRNGLALLGVERARAHGPRTGHPHETACMTRANAAASSSA